MQRRVHGYLCLTLQTYPMFIIEYYVFQKFTACVQVPRKSAVDNGTSNCSTTYHIYITYIMSYKNLLLSSGEFTDSYVRGFESQSTINYKIGSFHSCENIFVVFWIMTSCCSLVGEY
jgi:hypothetical protein